MKLSNDVLAVLDQCSTIKNILHLPMELERALYQAVNKVLLSAGGRWDRKLRSHVFDGDAADAIESILLTGEVSNRKQEFGQFDTPSMLAVTLAEMCDIKPGERLLEPSAGIGTLAITASLMGAEVTAYELDPKRFKQLAMRDDIETHCADFLKVEPSPVFDVVLMNPPFAKRADVRHVMHANAFLKPGGRLVSVMGAGITFRQDTLTAALRNFISIRQGTIEPLPEDSFKSAGTSVNTVVVRFTVT